MTDHSVNCYFCNELVDERDCTPADDYNNNDGGDICEPCQDKRKAKHGWIITRDVLGEKISPSGLVHGPSHATATIDEIRKDGQMLATMPRGYDKKRFFIAMTVASGETYAGLHAGDMYVTWKRYDKRLALVEPNLRVRSTGDAESRSSVKRLYTDRIILDVPIVSMDGGSPVIDMDSLLVGQASKFFGSRFRVSNSRLITIKKAKAFPKNVELALETYKLQASANRSKNGSSILRLSCCSAATS